MKYVFILSLDHSRSTVLDMHLARHSGGVSMGEVRRTLWPSEGEKKNRIDCSCGAVWGQCSFWCRLDEDFVESCDYFVNKMQLPLIDSSKELAHYARVSAMLQESKVPSCAVILVREYSEWRASVVKSNSRHERGIRDLVGRGKEHRLSTLRLLLRSLPLFPYAEWCLTNFRLIWGARRGESVLVTSATDASQFAFKLRGGYERSNTHSKHIVRGNRVARARSDELENFSASLLTEFLFKGFWKVVSLPATRSMRKKHR